MAKVYNGSHSYPFTRAGIQAAHDGLPATGGLITLPAGVVEFDGTYVHITKPNVRIQGTGNGTIIKLHPEINNTAFYVQGLVWDATLLDAAAVEGANTVRLAAPEPDAVAGAYALLVDPGTLYAQVVPVAGQQSGGSTPTVSLHTLLRCGFGAQSTLRILNPVVGTQFANIQFDGNGNNTTFSHCILAQNSVGLRIENVTATDVPCSLVYLDQCYNVRQRGCTASGSGDDQSAVFSALRSSQVWLDEINIWDGPARGASGGFGVSYNYCTGVHAWGVTSSNTNGRGLKFYETHHSHLTGCTGDRALNNCTGIMVVGNRNHVVDCRASGSAFVGLQVHGDYNQVRGGYYEGNGTDIYIGSGTGNVLDGVRYGTLNDSGVGTIVTTPAHQNG